MAGMGFSHAILAIEANGNKIINLKIPGCRPTVSPDGKHIAWGSSDHDLNTALLDTDSDEPRVGKWQMHIQGFEEQDLPHRLVARRPVVAFSRGPDGEGDLSKTGTFQAACEIIGVYAKDWNIWAVSAEHPGVIDLDKATDARFVQLTTDGTSNKEPAWFSTQARTKE